MAKIPPARIDAFLRRPDPKVRAALLYGPDAGQVRERADELARAVVDDLTDPFRTAILGAAELEADPARLVDEAAAIAFGGGRRVVRVPDAGNGVAVAEAVRLLLETQPGDGLVILEAGPLAPRSSLRKLFEATDGAAALPCYGDEGGDLASLIRDSLRADGLRIGGEALAYLVENLGGDRLVTRRELEKLALLAADGDGEVRLTDAVASVGDSAALDLDQLAFAAGGGDHEGLDRALARLAAEGANPVTMVRAAARHLERLLLVSDRLAAGEAVEGAMGTLRPKVFFKVANSFKAQLRHWPRDRLAAALDYLLEVELKCKSTGQPAQLICSRALMALARNAARHARSA